MKHVIAIMFMLLLGAQYVQSSLNYSSGTYTVSIDDEHTEKVNKQDCNEKKEVVTTSFTYTFPANQLERTKGLFIVPQQDHPFIDKPTPPPNAHC